MLSPAQAQRLGESLKIYDIQQPGTHKKPFGLTWVIGFAVIVLVVIVVAMSGGSVDTVQQVQDVSKAMNQQEGVGEMNKSVTTIVSLALLLIVPLVLFTVSYNGLVTKEEGVFSAWADVESNYQRRADLIPNLIQTVSKYMKHEASTLSTVVDKRSEPLAADSLSEALEGLVKAQENTANLLKQPAKEVLEDDKYFADVSAAQDGVGLGMRKLIALAENYPDLRSSDQMLELQAQLEGTENRINVARMRFNESAETFNSAMRRMPASMVASLGNFKRKAYFKSDEGANRAVNVTFE